MARLVAPKLALELGQAVVIDNKPGAGGNLGAAEAARSAADGYTLLMASPPLTISPALYSKLPYKPEQIVAVALLGRVPNVLMVSPESGIQSVEQLTALAKSKPGHRGAAAGLTGLMAGEVQLMFDNLPSALGLINGGKLKALAVTTPQRSSALPLVPTMEEAGMKGFQVSSWFGVAAPAGLPVPVLQKLEQALERVANQPEVKAAMLKAGGEPAWANSQGLAAFMQADTAQWKKVAEFAKIALD
jgi:tripartite-type tricarboxylate transporter receptor subunit TctC